MFGKIAAIALNTFKEAVRNRVLYVLLFFSVLIMLGAWVASTLSIDDETKIVRDLGAGAINFIALLIAVFVGIGLVYNDLDKKTIYTIISKPISRWQFLVGKYLGLLLTIAVNVMFMTWIFCAVLYLRGYLATDALYGALIEVQADGSGVYKGLLYHGWYIVWSIVKSLFFGLLHVLMLGMEGVLGLQGAEATRGLFAVSLLTILEMAIITAFAVLFSAFSSPTLSAFMTVIVFIIGRLNQELYLFADTMVQRAGGVEALGGGQTVAYYFSVAAAHIAPNLTIFNQRRELGEFQAIEIGVLDVSYGVAYTAMVLVIAIVIFNRRNFK